MTIAVCVKWSTPPSGGDERFAGISFADRAALEIALSIGEARHETVRVVTVTSSSSADRALRDAVACGAAEAVRVSPDGSDTTGASPDSSLIAATLADAVVDCSLVLCGDYSADRGSGSVPAFLAARLGVDQALGLVSVSPQGSTIEAVRRLDGARREVLRVAGRAVLSVEGSAARLRRASLRSVLASENHPIDVRERTIAEHAWAQPESVVPFRPRARVLPAPPGLSALDRVRVLTDAGASPARGETIELAPDRAAARIVEALRDWGYLPPVEQESPSRS